MSEINASNFKKEHGDLAPDLVGVTELTSPYFFVPPSGTTEERPQDCEPGTLRFNTDIGNLEIFRGDPIGWEQIQRRDSQYLGGGTGSNTGTGTRGLYMGGNPNSSPNHSNTIDFFTISTFSSSPVPNFKKIDRGLDTPIAYASLIKHLFDIFEAVGVNCVKNVYQENKNSHEY